MDIQNTIDALKRAKNHLMYVAERQAIDEAIDLMTKHQDGLMAELPKEGATVYDTSLKEYKIGKVLGPTCRVEWDGGWNWVPIDRIGKTVFLTREAAIAAQEAVK
jgi:hypothetical protein